MLSVWQAFKTNSKLLTVGCATDSGIAFGTDPREKKSERKRKNLIRLGIKQGQAYAWSRSRNEERIHECP